MRFVRRDQGVQGKGRLALASRLDGSVEGGQPLHFVSGGPGDERVGLLPWTNDLEGRVFLPLVSDVFPRGHPRRVAAEVNGLPLSVIGLLEEEVEHAGGGDAVVGLEVPEEALRLLAEDAMLVARSYDIAKGYGLHALHVHVVHILPVVCVVPGLVLQRSCVVDGGDVVLVILLKVLILLILDLLLLTGVAGVEGVPSPPPQHHPIPAGAVTVAVAVAVCAAAPAAHALAAVLTVHGEVGQRGGGPGTDPEGRVGERQGLQLHHQAPSETF